MSLTDIFFPKQCIICSKVGVDICDRCLTKIPKALPTCLICGKINNNGSIHSYCLKTDTEISYIQGWSVTKRYYPLFEAKRNINIYSPYQHLLRLLQKEHIFNTEEYKVQPLENNGIDKYLASFLPSNTKAKQLCLIGEKIEKKDLLLDRIRKEDVRKTVIVTIF